MIATTYQQTETTKVDNAFFPALRIMGSQGALEIPDPCYTHTNHSFVEGPMIEAVVYGTKPPRFAQDFMLGILQ